MKERKEGRKEEGRGKRREKEKTPATGVLTLSSLPLSLSSHLWLPGFQPRCFTSFDDANVTRHHHYQPTITTVSLSLSLCTPELDVKIPLHCIVHSLERAPRSTRFRVRVRTSVCVSPGQVNVLSLVVKRDREKERKSGEREREGGSKGREKRRRRRKLDPSDTLPLPPPFSLSTIPLDECISSSADAKGALLNSEDPCTISAQGVRWRFTNPRAKSLFALC